MVSFRPLDPEFPIERQMGIDAGPVVLVNLFTVDPIDQIALVEAWKSDAQWMKKQPGYISTQLHKAVGDGSMYLYCGLPCGVFKPRVSAAAQPLSFKRCDITPPVRESCSAELLHGLTKPFPEAKMREPL